MAEWKVDPLNKTVELEILSLPDECQARFFRISELLIEHGPQNVRMPHVRHVCGKLWEMRLGTGRALYTTAKGRRLVVVLHAFVKKTGKIPRRAIDLARQRAKEIK